MIRLEINVTHSCNARCLDCNRAIGLVRFSDMEITPELILAASRKIRSQRVNLNRVALAGGEPNVKNPFF